MALPADYVERVYAGILGKIIGVYLGRPFEGWPYARIMEELGEINYYVHEKRGVPLIVTDDDITGTFTFLRAMPDYGNTLALTPAQIGQTWLNYLIEGRTILWWGGLGNSTEHTAYLRLKQGIPAPRSGSMALNGQVVAEQIGAQIFIDGWAMIAPSDPALAGEDSLAPKGGATHAHVRFHFELPGAVQGWLPEDSIESRGTVTVENAVGHSALGVRSLALHYRGVATGRPSRAATATFTSPEAASMPGYGLLASPILYSGQTVRARLSADGDNAVPVTCGLYLRVYGTEDCLERIDGPQAVFGPGDAHEFTWRVPDTDGAPIAEIGVEVSSVQRANGVVYLDYLNWVGAPDVTLTRPGYIGTMWHRAWVNGVDQFVSWGETYRLIQNEGTGLLMQGTREWIDYRITADVTPHLVKSAGIAARVQGMRRYYALLLCRDGVDVPTKARLVKMLDTPEVLAEVDFPWMFGGTHTLSLEVVGATLRAWIDDAVLFTVTDVQPFTGGAVALVCEEGRTATNVVRVQPA